MTTLEILKRAKAAAPAPAQKKKSLAWLWILLAVLLLGGGGFAAWYFGLLDGVLGKPADTASTEKTLDEYKNEQTAADNLPAIKPVWSLNVTDEQKDVLENFIKNMASVKGGTFTMGASESDRDACKDESLLADCKTTHQVTLDDFYIGKYELTQDVWEAVMGKEGNKSFDQSPDVPVNNHSWNDIQNFIDKLNELTGLKFRFPTEAEWEYAARGGNKTKGFVYAGGKDINKVANYADNSDHNIRSVGQLGANELGLYDMSGNVQEFCADAFAPYEASSQKNPLVDNGSNKVVRGGDYGSDAVDCMVCFRSSRAASDGNGRIGVRLALSAAK